MKKRKPTRRPPPAADAAETARRVDVIVRLRLDGAQLHDLLLYANDPTEAAADARGGAPWDVTEAELARLIGRADDLLIARTDRKRMRAVVLQLARRDALYVRAINAGDYGVALSILKDQAALLGMYPEVSKLRQIVKAQEKLIREMETAHDAPRQIGPAEDDAGEVGRAEGGEGQADGGAEGEAGGG